MRKTAQCDHPSPNGLNQTPKSEVLVPKSEVLIPTHKLLYLKPPALNPELLTLNPNSRGDHVSMPSLAMASMQCAIQALCGMSEKFL